MLRCKNFWQRVKVCGVVMASESKACGVVMASESKGLQCFESTRELCCGVTVSESCVMV